MALSSNRVCDFTASKNIVTLLVIAAYDVTSHRPPVWFPVHP